MAVNFLILHSKIHRDDWLVQYLINNFSDFQLASIGSFVIHESVFFLSGLPFIVMERLGYQQKYKIQVHLDVVIALSCLVIVPSSAILLDM